MSKSPKPNNHSLHKLMSDAIDSGIPGLSVAIAGKDGLCCTGTAGCADLVTGEGVNTDHLFGIGSITKTFIAVIILQLVEEGRLQLSQTPLAILGQSLTTPVPGADCATLAHLLNHTSGIPSWEDDPVWIKEGRGERLVVDRVWCPEETLPYISHTPMTHKPGEAHAYSNTNHTLLGLVIEKVTGNTVVTEIRSRILGPLDLHDIYLEGFELLPAHRMANRYHYATPAFKTNAGIAPGSKVLDAALIDVSHSNLSVEWAAGGMVATATDLVKFAAALRSGTLLNAQSMAFLLDWFPIDEKREVGHGVFRVKTQTDKGLSGYSLVGHDGAVLGYTACMYWLEDSDLSLVVLANVGTMHIGQHLPSAGRLMFNHDFIKTTLETVSVLNRKIQ